MELAELTKEQCEIVRQWRNQDISIYKTSFLLTKEMQEKFYEDVICNRNSDCRFWGVHNDCGDLQPEKECLHFVGMVGLTSISLENRNAELSIVIDRGLRKQSLGEKALNLLLGKGFNELNLDNIYGECYWSNSAIKFWNKMILKYNAKEVTLPARKYWDGLYYNSLYFTFNKNTWRT